MNISNSNLIEKCYEPESKQNKKALKVPTPLVSDDIKIPKVCVVFFLLHAFNLLSDD